MDSLQTFMVELVVVGLGLFTLELLMDAREKWLKAKCFTKEVRIQCYKGFGVLFYLSVILRSAYV